jgi:transcriptional regulator with XRE-family HTH domain
MDEKMSIMPSVSDFSEIIRYYKIEEPKHIRAIEYLASGFSASQVAKMLKVSPSTLSIWLEAEAFRAAVSDARRITISRSADFIKMASVLAQEKVIDILAQDYELAPDAEKREIARTARFILEGDGQQVVSSQVNNIIVTPMSDLTADVIAKRIHQLEHESTAEEVSAEYTIKHAPRSVACHPETDFGVLNYNEDERTYQCHVCGRWYVDLYSHADDVHGLSTAEYKEAYYIQ